jgi:ceramide glucosyltransferase
VSVRPGDVGRRDGGTSSSSSSPRRRSSGRARRRDARAKDYRPPVTILKPLKGPGIDLYANLASFCRQDYPRFQIVCGVNDPSDPAIESSAASSASSPHCDVVLSIGDRPGANRKVANLST